MFDVPWPNIVIMMERRGWQPTGNHYLWWDWRFHSHHDESAATPCSSSAPKQPEANKSMLPCHRRFMSDAFLSYTLKQKCCSQLFCCFTVESTSAEMSEACRPLDVLPDTPKCWFTFLVLSCCMLEGCNHNQSLEVTWYNCKGLWEIFILFLATEV